eukprot:scaffold34774_cov76-Cyclotella_meneghiniana.AAC.1
MAPDSNLDRRSPRSIEEIDLFPLDEVMKTSRTAADSRETADDVEVGNHPTRVIYSMKSKDSNVDEMSGVEQSSGGENGGSSSAMKSLIASILYSGCSVGMVLVNKSLASSYNHLIDGDLNILLVVFQAITAVICVEFSKYMQWVDYPSFSLHTAKLWSPVNILFCGMLFTGMASLEHNSVPMVTIFKNITNIMTTVGDCILYGASIQFLVMAAFGIMLAGAVMAARNDTGYATKSVKLSKFGMVFYNNLLCSLFLIPVTMLNGEFSKFMSTPALHTMDYAVKNAFAGFVGFFLNFASLNCVAQTGPTTYAMIGSLNKIPIAIFGYFIFDNAISEETWTFISISLLGGVLYTVAKLREGQKKSKSVLAAACGSSRKAHNR